MVFPASPQRDPAQRIPAFTCNGISHCLGSKVSIRPIEDTHYSSIKTLSVVRRITAASILLFLPLLAGVCHALPGAFPIERATTPQQTQQINLLLGGAAAQPYRGEQPRQALGVTERDGPVERFVALDRENDSLVVGCVDCQMKRPDTAPSVAHFLSPYLHLYNLHVAPSMRRQGLGTALVERVIEECEINGDNDNDDHNGGDSCCQGVLLSVDATNAASAVHIYEKLGFRVSGVKFEGETPMFRPNSPP